MAASEETWMFTVEALLELDNISLLKEEQRTASELPYFLGEKVFAPIPTGCWCPLWAKSHVS